MLAQRHEEFLKRGGRLYGISADTPGQNAAVMEKLALPFPILSDVERTQAVEPLGFSDEKDPRQISRAGVVIVAPTGEEAFRHSGRDFADRPDEDLLLDALSELTLEETTQEAPARGEPEPGEKAMPYEGIPFYLRGAKFAALALRARFRDLGDPFTEETKLYVQMVERYIDALTAVEERRA